MWVAKFKAWHDSQWLQKTKNLEARARVHYLNIFKEGNKRFIMKVMLVEGKDKEQLIQCTLDESRCHSIEVAGDQVFYYLEESEGFSNMLLDHRVFFVGPVIMEGGQEHWTVASHQKKDLTELHKSLKRLPYRATLELVSLKKETPHFFVSTAMSKLTELERRTMEMARNHGYFEHPRQTNAKELAKMLKVPRSTLTERLRKAEAKLIPEVLDSR
ncbi:helix-turn-helix domain-containing protein [Candidatus Micrarchaeota archaeon]|nr:helix-turn-helix domain-containing protein [Candidatus Micrarchaeota archaeon]